MGKSLLKTGCQISINIKTDTDINEEKVDIFYVAQKYKSGMYRIENFTYTYDLIKPGFSSLSVSNQFQY